MRASCPSCDRKLLSSVSPTCGWCGFALPEHLKPTEESIRTLRAQEEAEAKRERELERLAKESNFEAKKAIWRQL